MTHAVRDRHPTVTDRLSGKELALLIGIEEARTMLAAYAFTPLVTFGEGECVIRLPELGLVAAGPDLEAATAELADLADEYVVSYLERVDFHRHVSTHEQLPWVMRLALADGTERRLMLEGDRPE